MRYTRSHEWISVDGKIGTVGITKYAQGELGEIVYVALPKVGESLKIGGEAAVLESTKAASDVYTPVSGTIVAVNEKIKDSPALLNTDPETEGWLFRLEIAQVKELETLLAESDYVALIS